MAQAQGSKGRLVIMPEDTFKTTPVTVIEDCEDAWTQGDVDFTVTADTGKVGTNCVKIAVAALASAGDLMAYEDFTAKDLSAYTRVGFWCKSSVALASGDLQLLLDNTSACESPLETLNIPAIVTADLNTWVYRKVTIASPAALTAIISVGLKYTVDKGAMDFYIDDVKALNVNGQIVPFISESLKLSRSLERSNVIRDDRQPQAPTRGNVEVGGDITTELNPHMTTLLKHLMGAVETTDLTGGKYSHAFTIDDLPAGLSIEKQFTDILQYIIFNGMKVNSLKISCKAAGKIDTSLGLMGAKENTATTLSGLDSDPTDWGHTPFDAFEAAIEEGGSSIATVLDVEFELANDMDGSIFCIGGGGERGALPAGIAAVSGKITAMFENLTLYNKAVNHTESSLKLTLTKGTGDGSAGNELIEFHFEELIYKPDTPVISGPKGVLVEMPFECYFGSGSNGSALKITVKNTQASVI